MQEIMTLVKDTLKEKVKNIDSFEIEKKISPDELLSKSSINGISGGTKEIESIREELSKFENMNKYKVSDKLLESEENIKEKTNSIEIAKETFSPILKEKLEVLIKDMIHVEIDKIKSKFNILFNSENDELSKYRFLVRSEVDKESEKEKITKNSEYSDEINNYITTEEELKIYQNEGLEEGEVNDRKTLKDNDIDPDLKDSKGRTNLERMEKGLAPLDENGKPYNLHHIGQKADSPLAELKDSTHKKYDSSLHDKTQKTEVHNEDSSVNWDKERSEHWKARAEEIKNEREQNV